MNNVIGSLLSFLVNSAWLGALVAVIAVAADRLLRRSSAGARTRHLLWVAALIASVLVPLRNLPRHAAARQLVASAPNEPLIALTQLPPPAGRLAATPVRRWWPRAFTLSTRVALFCAAIYLILPALRMVVLTAAWWHTRRMLRSACRPELSHAALSALIRSCQAMNVRDVRVLASDAAVPFTFGARRALIVLPQRLLQNTDVDVLTAALGHELAHVARRDYVLNLLYEFFSLPLWFHPAVMLMRRRIRQTRELRCDELVAERLQDARVYAQSLLELAGAALPFGRAAATLTVGIADADILEERVKSLLHRPHLRKQTLISVAAALLLLVPCIAAAALAFNVTVKEDTALTLAQDPQTTPIQQFAAQHQIGDTVQGKVMMIVGARAVVELAPGLNTVMRIPKEGAATFTPGSAHTFRVVRLDPDEDIIGIADPSYPLPAPETVSVNTPDGERQVAVTRRNRMILQGNEPGVDERNLKILASGGPEVGVLGGVNGGVEVEVLAGVEGGVLTGQEGGVMVRQNSREQDEARAKAESAEERARAEREEMTPELKEKIAQELQARRKAMLQNAREAKITMDQAIQIALGQQAGAVVESRLARERDQATYIISVLSGDEQTATTTRFLISALDGKVLDTFRTEPGKK